MANLGRNPFWLSSAAMVAALAIAQPAQAQVRKFNIAAGAASETIPLFGKQAGMQVLAATRVVRGKRTNNVMGQYSVDEALRLLLAGSGLVAGPVRNGVITISAIRLSSADPGDVPGPQPRADSTLPDGDPAQAGDEGNAEIVVTGTNIRGGRPTSPVLVVTRRDIEASGSTTVEQLMRKIPQNSQAGVGQETFFNATASGTDHTESGAGVNLRGLGQRASLVLLNGRRVAPSSSGAFFDISLIPLSAVERVEILTDGASAIYGSDAVGGVVNFILRHDFNGVETLVEAGTATEGDGDTLRAGVTAGKSWGSGNVMLSYEYRRDDEIRAGDRAFVKFPDDTFIIPRERRHSLLGTFEQGLSSRLKLELTGTYSRRETEHTFFYAGQAFPVAHAAKAELRGATGQLSYELGSSWLARLQGGYSVSENHSRERPSDGSAPIGLDSRNRTLDGMIAIDGSLVDLPAGPLKLAFGGGIRSENARNLFTSGVGNADRRISRDIKSAYGELSVPLFSERNAVPGLRLLQLSAAARYEDYSRLKSTFDPKLGILWSPLRGLNLRASYGTSFKAPLLLETIGFYQAIYLPVALLSAAPSTDNRVALFMSGSNPDVGPERATTWTFGGDIEPAFIPGLTLSVNYYRIRFSDRIATPSQTISVVGDPAFESIITRNPSLAQVTDAVNRASFLLDISGPGFSNGGATPADVKLILDDRTGNTKVTRTSGIDFLLGYRFAVGPSTFNLEANVNHVIGFEDQLTVTSPPIVGVNRPYRSLRWKGRGGISWSKGGWLANLFANYADHYIDNRTINLVPVHSWTTFDAGLSYDFGTGPSAGLLKNTRIAFHVENMFDKAPPRFLPDPGSTTGLGFDPVNATGRGRIVTLQIRKLW